MKRPFFCCLAGVLFVALCAQGAEMDKVGTLFTPVLEWSVDNPDWDGNPFDVIASATFTHTASGEQRRVGMFYDGGTTWKFRFSGTRLGEWTFTTGGDDPDLSGHTGTVTIKPNPDPDAYGFVTTVPSGGLAKRTQSPGEGGVWHVGNKWARYNSSGDLETFIPHFRMGFEKSNFNWGSSEIDGWLNKWMGDEGFNGVHVFMAGYWVNRDGGSTFENKDPDNRSFDILENMIKKIHNRGGVTHIWYCGDCARSQCPQAGFGDNGAATDGEKKLLRHIGSRLGPLPGWIMGYGYDLPEHVNTSELRGWGNYLRDNMAYDHMLGARDQGGNINYSLWPEADFYSRGHWFGGQSYSDIVGVLNSNSNKAHSNDERWYDGRLGNEENLRRQMWDCNIAGGMSAIFGHNGDWEKDPYSNPQWFKTCFTFWEHRLFPSMAPDNGLTNGKCLITSDKTRAIFYKESTDKVEMNLSGFNGKLSAVAVDAKKNYEEIDVSISKSDMTWDAPYSSDWAVAVGEGDAPQPQPEDDTPPTAPSNLNASAAGNSQIDLSWDAASDGESGVDSYNIYRNGSKVASSNGTSYSDQGLDADTEYKYRVSAVNGAGLEGDKSNEVSATTEAGGDPDPNPNPTPNPEGVTVSAEKELVGGGRKPVYKVVEDTVHMIYTKGDGSAYYQRLTTSGDKIGNEEGISDIEWMTSGFNAGIQNPSLAYRDGKLVVASGDNSGFMRVAVKKGGSWVHSEKIDEAGKSGGYKRIVDPDVAIESDGTVHIVYQKYGNDDEVHAVLDANSHSVTTTNNLSSGQGEHSIRRLMVTGDNTLHLAYVHHIHEVYYRQYDGSWTDAMNVKSQGGYTGHVDMDISGNTAYVLFSQGGPQFVAMTKVDLQSRNKEVMKVADLSDELFSQSIGVNKDHGTIHATYWHRTGDFNAAELQYIYSEDDGQSWSSPEKITQSGANFGKAWITYVGNNKSIIIYSDQRNNVYMRTFNEGGTGITESAPHAESVDAHLARKGVCVRATHGGVLVTPGTSSAIRNITVYDSFGKVLGAASDVAGQRSIAVNATGVFYVDIRLRHGGTIRRKLTTLY